MMWTPAKLPPHPSTVPTLSPFAQMVLDGLKREMNESKHAHVNISTASKHQRSNEYNHFLVRDIDEEYSTVGRGANSHRHISCEDTVTNMNSHLLHHLEPNSDIYNDAENQSIFSNMVTQTSNRQNHMIYQNNNNSLSKSNNVDCRNKIRTFMSQHIRPTGIPSDSVSKCVLDICTELSPDMEFENMEVYSLPQGGTIINPNNTLNSHENTTIRQRLVSTRLPPQLYKGNLLCCKDSQSEIPQNKIHRPKQFGASNLKPSDQTFVFSDKRSSQEYKNKLGIFQSKNNRKETKTVKLQSSPNKPIASTNGIIDIYDGKTCERRVIDIPNRELILERKKCVQVNEEIQNCHRREGLRGTQEHCSYEISDLSFENALTKYYNEDSSQLICISPKSTKHDTTDNLDYGEMNITSQPELSENCESLFTKTQDYGQNDESCLTQKETVKSKSSNIPPDKFNRSCQGMENSRLFHNFEVDDLFSSTDGPFENHKPNVVKEIQTCGTKHQIISDKILTQNFDPRRSFQHLFPTPFEQKQEEQNYKGELKVFHSFEEEKTEPNMLNLLLPENLAKQDQEIKDNLILTDNFDVDGLFTQQNKHQPKSVQIHTSEKLKSNVHSNINNDSLVTPNLPKYKTNPQYSNTKTFISETEILNDIPSPIHNKSTKIEVHSVDDGIKMSFSELVVQDTSLVSIKEKKSQIKDKTTSKSMKSHEALEQKVAHRCLGKLNEENNTEDAFTLLFENYDYDKLSTHIAAKQEKVSKYFPDTKILNLKTDAESSKLTESHNKRRIQLNNQDLNYPRIKSKTAADVSTTASDSHPNQVNKTAMMKQATIFDCKKFFSPDSKERIKMKTDSQIQSSNNTKHDLQFDNFKKPQTLNNKLNMSTKSSSKQCNTKTTQFNNKTNTLSEQKTDMTSVDRQCSIFQSNYHETNFEKKSAPSKINQTSFNKTQSDKRTWPSDASKLKKKPRFTAPVIASHSTSKDAALKNYTITILDDISAHEILRRLLSEAVNKLVMTVTFKEGYTLLNKPENPMKNSRCSPSGIMLMAFWASSKTDFFWLQLHREDVTQGLQTLIQELFTKASRVVCFEAQAVFMLLMDVFHSKTISNWYAYDPLIGCWLLDPDNPPKDFVEVVSKLDVDKKLLVVNPKADIKTQACDLLPVLDIAMTVLEKRLENASLLTLFSDMEMKLTPLLAVMELSSILVDVRKLHEIAGVLDKRLKYLQKEAYGLAGRSFQLNSHQQLRQILFDELKLDVKFNVTVKQTDQGSKSTSEAVLLQFTSFHPLPKIVLEFRHLQKVKSTYVDGLIQFVKHDGTIGTIWEQVGAATGRITSKNPNLQAIPKVTVQLQGEESIYLRAVFKAREGFTFLAADFQQIEFRVFAHYTEDNTLLQVFRKGGDIFQELAGHWLGGTGPVEREKTKRIVYSVMYGAGAQKLAEYLQVTFSEASSIIASFIDKFPCLRSLPRTVVAQCRTQGYVVTLSGRRRLFPNIRSTNYKLRAYSERQAVNFLIQGSAADICKAAMLDCDADLKCRGLDAKLLLQIHDELVWEVADPDLQQTAQTVRRAMEHHWGERLALRVPVPVCVSGGKTLANMQPLAHELDFT